MPINADLSPILGARSNPLAGTDTTLLALAGAGYADGRCFGFASCERRAGAAEGVNALVERRLVRPDGRGHEYAYNHTNVEYTEFGRLGVADECAEGGGGEYSRFPANTNVLYIGLKARARWSGAALQPAPLVSPNVERMHARSSCARHHRLLPLRCHCWWLCT